MAPCRRRHTTTIAALVLLALPLLAACSQDSGRATDCAGLAKDLAKDASALKRALADNSKDPQSAQEFVDKLNRDLGKLAKRDKNDTGVKDAIGELTAATDDIQDSIGDGERPDAASLTKAAASLTKACTAG